MNTAIEVTELKTVNGGNVKAYVSVRVGDWEIHNFRIIQKPGQVAWIQAPETTWKGQNGKIYYRQLLTLPAEMMQRITVRILSRWEEENLNGSTT
jgi:hypothetical protein